MLEATKIGARVLGGLTGLFALLLFAGGLWVGIGFAADSGVTILIAVIAAMLLLLGPALVAAYGLIRLRSWALWLEIVVLGFFTLSDYRVAWVSVPVVALLLSLRGSYMTVSQKTGSLTGEGECLDGL